MTRPNSVLLYVPALAIVLMLLLLAMPDAQPSAAEMMPVVFTFEATQPASQEDIAAASEVLRQRLLSYPQSGVQFALESERLVVSMPPGAEPSIVVAEASHIGQVEVVDGGTEFLTVGGLVKTGPHAIPDQDVYRAVLTSDDFIAADARLGDEGQPVIEFTLTPAGAARLAAHTASLPAYYLCLAVDGQVVNCPILRTPLVNRQGLIELTGDATLDDARALAMLLRSGPLPVPLRLSGVP
jgi:hypothetical protein